MLDPKFITGQLERLRFTKFFPASEKEAYFEELRRVLQRAASEFVVVGVIDDWLDTQSERPTVTELSRLLNEHNKLVAKEEIESEPDLGPKPEPMSEAERAEFAAFCQQFEQTIKAQKTSALSMKAERRMKSGKPTTGRSATQTQRTLLDMGLGRRKPTKH